MSFDTRLFGELFVTLFVIMDPPGTIPIFLSLTGGRPQKARKRIARQAAIVAFLVIVAFALFGQTILDYLGITLPALQLAGGLLLLLVALELLTGRADEPARSGDVNVALVPLGTPLLADLAPSWRRWCSSSGSTMPAICSRWRQPSWPSTWCCGCRCGSASSSSG